MARTKRIQSSTGANQKRTSQDAGVDMGRAKVAT
jgi:hypothetical protein